MALKDVAKDLFFPVGFLTSQLYFVTVKRSRNVATVKLVAGAQGDSTGESWKNLEKGGQNDSYYAFKAIKGTVRDWEFRSRSCPIPFTGPEAIARPPCYYVGDIAHSM